MSTRNISSIGGELPPAAINPLAQFIQEQDVAATQLYFLNKKACRDNEAVLTDDVYRTAAIAMCCLKCTVRLTCLDNDYRRQVPEPGILAGFNQEQRTRLYQIMAANSSGVAQR